MSSSQKVISSLKEEIIGTSYQSVMDLATNNVCLFNVCMYV